jgi:hypothetical protein
MSTESGEWLQYTITVPAKGKFVVALTVSAKNAGGNIGVSIDGAAINSGIAVLPGTWQTVEAGTVELTKGQHVLRILINEGGFDLKDIKFSAAK